MNERTCCYCGRIEDHTLNERGKFTVELRPYGPGGTDICFGCATLTPERKNAAENAFYALLEANEAISPTGVVAIGQDSGPVPFDPRMNETP
jgi:hypothetical protein